MKRLEKIIGAMLGIMLLTSIAAAAPGDLLATVNLPMPVGTSVGGTFDGTNYISVMAGGNDLYIMSPPPGDGWATLVATKPIVDGANNPVYISAVAWDPTREMVWGAYGNAVYLIDISGLNAVATFQFNPEVGGISLIDGLAYDASDDTLYHSPDVDMNVYHFATDGTLLNTITPKNAAGQADGRVSGVVVGSGNTLYIGRDGAAEIRWIDKTTGNFISQFATTSGRVEDLTCDPVTYWPKEAVLSKDAYNGLYEAFEVEPGTCPLQIPFTVEKDFRHTNVNFVPIDPCTGNKLPAILGELLPDADIDGKYDVKYVLKPKDGTVSSTNPGQLYGVKTIEGAGVDTVQMVDTFDTQFDVNPAHRGGGVEILRIDAGGYATVLTDDLVQVPTVVVDNTAGTVNVDIDLETPLGADEKLMIYIKYKTALKGLLPDYDDFVNNNEVTINGGSPIPASATVEFV